jgi:hypothetical protein
VSEQDGEMKTFETGAIRSKDAEDVDYTLIPPAAMEAWAKVCAYGSSKYCPYNWERGLPARDILNHALRHIYKFLEGDRSEDHLPHALWNVGAAIHSLALWPHLNTDLRREGCIPPNVSDEEAWAWKGMERPTGGGTEPDLAPFSRVDIGGEITFETIKANAFTPKNFYFAAQSSRAEELRGYRNQLEWSASNVTSRWIDRGRPYHSAGLPSEIEASVQDSELIQDDWNDLDRADAIVLFSDNHLMAAEYHQKVATHHNKKLIIVGPNGLIEEPGKVSWYPTWAAFLQSLDAKVADRPTAPSRR